MTSKELAFAVLAVGVLLLAYPVRVLRQKNIRSPERRRLALWKPLAVLTILVLLLAMIMFILPASLWL